MAIKSMRILLSNNFANARDRAVDCFDDFKMKGIEICNEDGGEVRESQGLAKISTVYPNIINYCLSELAKQHLKPENCKQNNPKNCFDIYLKAAGIKLCNASGKEVVTASAIADFSGSFRKGPLSHCTIELAKQNLKPENCKDEIQSCSEFAKLNCYEVENIICATDCANDRKFAEDVFDKKMAAYSLIAEKICPNYHNNDAYTSIAQCNELVKMAIPEHVDL